MIPESITAMRTEFLHLICEGLLSIDAHGVASNADNGSEASKAIALHLASSLGAPERRGKLPGQTAGKQFEEVCKGFLTDCFGRIQGIRPGTWGVDTGSSGIAKFQQFSHLTDLRRLCEEHSELAVALGKEHIILPDVVIWRRPEPDVFFSRCNLHVDRNSAQGTPIRLVNNDLPILHASVSCKWTIRSDRAQNARTEALNLVRNRKGRVPHIVAITGEPLPSRLASLALGTGDIDCVYHFALSELIESVRHFGQSEAVEMLDMLVEGKRLRDLSDLPFDLII